MEMSYTKKIYELYRDYINWSCEFLAEHGGLNLLRRIFTGNAEYNRQTEHVTFFNACKEASEEYLAALTAGQGRDELVPLMEYVLISCHEGRDDCTDWMLLAAEKSFIPFLEHLSAEEASALYGPYHALRRKNRGLPPQDEIRKILKKAHK